MLLTSIHEFIQNDSLKNDCVKYVVKPEAVNRETDPNDIVKLYLQLSNESNVSGFILNNKPKLTKINVLKFLHFGLIHGFLSRVHEYPIRTKENQPIFFNNDNFKLLKTPNDDDESDKDKIIVNTNSKLNDMLQKGCCMDEICVELGITRTLFDEVAMNKDIYCILK